MASPSSSHDWAAVAEALAAEHTLLAADFLGFGASAKPTDHTYSLHEQADLIEALWEREQISATSLVAHDYGVSVAQELLARKGEGTLKVELERVHFLNGGLYPDCTVQSLPRVRCSIPSRGPSSARC